MHAVCVLASPDPWGPPPTPSSKLLVCLLWSLAGGFPSSPTLSVTEVCAGRPEAPPQSSRFRPGVSGLVG